MYLNLGLFWAKPDVILEISDDFYLKPAAGWFKFDRATSSGEGILTLSPCSFSFLSHIPYQ